jgi:hypothetical protein
MSTFQPTKKKKETSSDVFQPTSRKSYDTTVIYGWEVSNRESLDILNDYNNRINKSEWLDEEDRAKYRSALDTYIETANLLREINKTFGAGYSDEDEQKWTESIASMNSAYDSTEKYYSQWIDEKDYKGQRDGWLQKSNLWDDGYQFGDITKTVAGTVTDIVENIGAGIMGMGEAALDALITLGSYYAQGQYYANGGGYNLHADEMFEQSNKASKEWASDFVQKDLYDEQAVAKAIIADPVKALINIDAETDSVFGEKSDSLIQSAGQLAGTVGLQAVGVPWWLTTGATTLGGESENALKQGATLDQATLSGIVSAGAEILTEKISGGISFGGKTLDDVIPKLTAKISNKVVRNLLDLGIDMVGEGAEEVLSGYMSAIGQKLSYASESEISELFSSEDALDSFIGGAVLGLGGGVVRKGKETISANKQAREIYGNGADLVTKALDIDPNNAIAQKMQAKLDKGKTLSGGQIRSLVEANENAVVSQDKGKMKTAVESRLTELGESDDVSKLADVIVKAQSGEKLTSSERSTLVNSKYGRRVSTELNPMSIESGEYSSKWAENIGTERINADAYNRGVAETSEASVPQTKTASATKNATVKENAIESEISLPEGVANQPVAKAVMFDNEGNEVEAKVAKIADVENGEASLELEGGETVKASEVDFGDSGIGFVYKAATEMVSGVGGFNVDAANVMVKGFNPNGSDAAANLYVAGFNEAYRYGAMGYPVTALATGGATSRLSVAQREAAYNLGKAYGEGKVSAKQAKIVSTMTKNAANISNNASKVKKGKVYFDGSAVGKSLTERQRASLKGLRVVAEATGVNIRIFESPVGKDGKRQGANGWYDPVTKEIHLDLHAGIDGNGLMLFTASHELTHHIREVAPAKFKIFADALLEEYTKNGVSIDELISRKLETLEANGRLEGKTKEQAYDLAYEEVVADAAESMLVDSNAIEALSRKIQAKDKSLWETIKDFIAKLVARIKAAYEGIDPDSREGKLVREMQYSAERLQKLWVDALLEASEVSSDLAVIDTSTESVAPIMNSERTWTTSEYVIHRDQMAEKIAKALDVSVHKAKSYIDDINSIARMIANDRVRLDYEASSFGSAFVSNVEYGGSFDYTTLCKKRRIYTGTFTEIQKRLNDVALSPDDILTIRNLLIEEGVEATCGLCYVEGSRANMGKFAKEFIKLYKRDNPLAWIPNMADVNTPDGVEQMRISHPEAYEQYVYFWNHYGKLTESDPALFASQQKPKLYEARKEYKGEILEHFKGDFTVAKKNLNGGIRMQSFSDFEIVHLIDTMQVIMDMSTVGLAGQAYTKVPEFAKAFGNTGLKINLSLIAKGVDADGNLIFDDREGMPHDTAFDLRDKYSKNVGTIIVTFTDGQLLAAMADPRIDFIIPFHRSQWKKGQYGAMGLPKGTKDYTFMQNEKLIKQTYHEYQGRMVKDKASNYMPNEYWDFTKSGKENAEAYLKMCAENNKRPKFYKLLDYDGNGTYSLKADGSTNGYWKLLIDFKMYDNAGVGSPQESVTPTFNMDEAKTMLAEYQGGHSKYPVASSVVDKFIERYNKENRTKYSDRDSLGNELSKEQQEYFKDSKVRDKKGNLMVLYHGTTANFNTFKKGDVGFHFGTKGAARGRVGFGKNATLKEVYLNITNPIVFDEDLGSWDADFRLTRELYDKGILTQADAESVLLTDNRMYKRTTEAANKKLASVLLEKGYDGIAYSNTFETKNPTTSYIVFNSNQAKEITNNAPTSNPDIRYSDRDSLGNELSKKQKEFFKDSKARDEEGNLLVLYHGTSTEQRITEFKTTEGWRTGLWLSTDHETSVHFARATEYVENDPGDDTKLFTKENSSDGTGRQGVYELYANVKNPLIVDAQGKHYWGIPRPSVMGDGGPVSGEEINAFALENDYDGVIIEYVVEGSNRLGTDVIVFSPNQVKYTDNLNPTESNDIRYSDRQKPSYAPTFYSHMGKVIDDIKLEKMGSESLLNHLKNRGVKAEELKWSGIETFLEGKKSVTKAELQEFVAGSQLTIEEEIAADEDDGSIVLWQSPQPDVKVLYIDGKKEDIFRRNAYGHWVSDELGDVFFDERDILDQVKSDYGRNVANTKWSQYKLDGGSNYRELVFKMPDSTYSNNAMRAHWGDEGEGILAHARIQDMSTSDGKKMLFIEEIQSDWHNEGHQKGYVTKEYEDAVAVYDKLAEDYANKRRAFNKYVRSGEFRSDPDDVSKKKFDWLRRKMDDAEKRMQAAERDVDVLKEKGMGDVPNAPFRSNYHEYVLKRLIRMAAEEGYDSIGWTPADIQSKRWSEDYAEGYRIEYDQDIPKFLRKYGKKWGATVGKERIGEYSEQFEVDLDTMEDSDELLLEEGIKYDGIEVWSMAITDSMKDSVLYEGQALYQDRNPDSYSNRSLLAGALETAVQNDIERDKLRQYKEKIDLINSEEQKLHNLREQIKELSFKKGPRDTQAIKSLQFEANQAANRINTYDRQLLNLESTKALRGVLEREKALARKKAEQRAKEALERQRERAAKTQRELMDRYQESRKKATESRNKTAMRHKIKDVVNELNQYLLKGTKDKHVPIELQKAVAEALDAVNMDTVGAEERIAKKRAEMMSAKSPEVVERLAKEIETIQEMGGNMAKKISRLKTAYDSIINSDDPLVANSHDDVISSSIERVMEYVGETPLRDMSLSQLEAVYDMYRMVLHSISAANKAFKAKKSEEISVIANRVMEEVDKLDKKKSLQSKLGQTISELDWDNQKPVYAFERIGSDTFTEVFNNVRAGEDTWAADMTEAQDFREEQYKRHKYDSWDFKKRYEFTSASGMKFELTLPQIMSLYAYSKRDQAAEHLKRGGIVFDETTEVTAKNKLGIPTKFNPTEATAYNISEETLANIISKLTAEQKSFVDEMQDYLSTTMGEKGNEVSLELYGVKLFKEKHYFPLKSASQFMARAKEQQKGEVKIKNSGFTKETVRKANNPIVLTPFMDVWASHVNEMSMYHAFTLALEDFYRVYNYKTPTSETMATESVEMFLQNAHGKGATKYIDQLLKDLNGGARVDSTVGIINKLTGLFKKSAVFASASVVVQQPSSIARATALVDTKYFVGKPSKHKETWAEVKKYAPVAIIKEMGYFDTGMGKSSVEWLKGEKTWKDKVDDVASKAPALADEYAWCAIWNAVKRETVHNNPKLSTSSDEFLKLVGERFTEVVTKTQVYDSVLSRSANMRSKDTGMKMATAFMGEPTTSLNMLQDALIQGKRGNKKYAAKAIGGVVSSMILNSILVSIVYAGRDDDEEKTYAEKYISTLTEELLDSFNPLTLIPFIKDIVSIVQGYDIERSDMAVITDLINAWNNLDSDNRSAYRKVEDFGGAIAAIFGLPVKNVMRDVRGMYNTINSFVNGEKTTEAGISNAIAESITGKEKSNGQQLYEAIVKGDSAQVERIKGRFEDEKAVDAAIRKALRENDPRIREAAEAYLNRDYVTYNKLRDKIISEGVFSRDIVNDALKAEYNYLKNKDKDK